MIVKVSQRKTDSSFVRLADYICRTRPDSADRIQSVSTAGFEIEEPDWEVAARSVYQQHREKSKNARKPHDDTLHVIVSFRPAEREALDAEALGKIAQRVCDSIKLGDHKRITAVHGDTQDPRMHLAINLLDGDGRRRTPYKAFLALRDVREAIETEYGFAPPSDRAGARVAQLSDQNQKRASHGNKESFEDGSKRMLQPTLPPRSGAQARAGRASKTSSPPVVPPYGNRVPELSFPQPESAFSAKPPRLIAVSV